MTVIVSETLPTLRAAFTVSVTGPVSSRPSRLFVLKPLRVNVGA